LGEDDEEESAASNADREAEAAAADFPNAAREEADEATSRRDRRWIREEAGGGEDGALGDDEEEEEEDEVLDRRRAFIAPSPRLYLPPVTTGTKSTPTAPASGRRRDASPSAEPDSDSGLAGGEVCIAQWWRMRSAVGIGDSVLFFSLRRETRGVKKTMGAVGAAFKQWVC
jgi:hypothetical protein